MHTNNILSPDFSSSEAQRLYYLRLLGISSFYPRYILPGALPSPVYELQEPAPEVTGEPEGQGNQPELHTTGAATALLKAEVPPVPGPAMPGSQKPTPVPRVASAGTDLSSLQFQLVLLQTDSSLAICNQIPALANKGMSDREFKLLGNILHWLGCPLGSGFAQRRFLWPLPGLASADRPQAGRTLQGFLDQAHKELAFTHLLMLGSSGNDCLQEFRETAGKTTQPWQQFSSHSLAEMLALPQLKREAWQQLLPLRAMLAKRSG